MDFSKISLLIIAGGKSSRMKQDKRLIEIGGITLLERILIKASKQNFSKIYLCVEDDHNFIRKLANKYHVQILIDEIKNSGPMSGLVVGLNNIETDWALALSCDMPFFEFAVVAPLLEYLANNKFEDSNFEDYKVVMFNHQPLAAFYHKSLASIFKKSLESNQRRLHFVINQVPNKIVELQSENNFFNVNKPEDLRLAFGRAANENRKVPIISIVAPSSGTGKTTFIERLIPKLNKHGIKIGVVKSDSHGFNLDIEGKDSWRFNQAGANSVAIVSPAGWLMTQKTDERADFFKIADKMDDVDLILTESRSHGTIPAISLYRGLGEPLINETVAAIFTEKSLQFESTERIHDILRFDLNDIDQAVKICLFLIGRST